MSLPPLPPAPGRMIPHWCTDEIDAIEAYGAICRKQALEEAAALCESRITPGTGSVAILRGAADEIRSLI